MKTLTRCPDWCAGGHHCTARLGTGEHASTPEVWDTDIGRLVATRYGRGRRSWIEVTVSVRLPEVDTEAQTMGRHLIAAVYASMASVAQAAQCNMSRPAGSRQG